MLSLFKSSSTMMFKYCNQLSGCYLAVCTSSLSVDIEQSLVNVGYGPFQSDLIAYFETKLIIHFETKKFLSVNVSAVH